MRRHEMNIHTNRYVSIFALTLLLPLLNHATFAASYEAKNAEINRKRVVQKDAWVTLKAGKETLTHAAPEQTPDVTFRVTVPEDGLYALRSQTAVAPEGRQRILRSKTRADNMNALMRLEAGYASRRVLVEAPCKDFDKVEMSLGNLYLTAGTHAIHFWLPEHARLMSLDVRPFRAPNVPPEAEAYEPKIVPPASRPRLWVRQETLPDLRARLTTGDNAEIWQAVKADASKPCKEINVPTGMASGSVPEILKAIREKAFVALIENDEALGREAITRMTAYFARVELGNVRDITRDVGETIHTAAVVYDWCHTWLTDDEKKKIPISMLSWAADLECSYPPFGRNILIGHGNESMILRDLLSVGIAIYETDPAPYRYCAWHIMEKLVPMRAFQYQSSRHDQGKGYAFYRCQWELYAALMFREMSGESVFNPNILNLRNYLLHMRVPTGAFFPDGDGGGDLPKSSAVNVTFLLSALGHDPLMKGEHLRYRGLATGRVDRVEYLLFNDPQMKPVFTYQNVPRAIDTGRVLTSHILRTAWMDEQWMRGDLDAKADGDPNSDAVIVEYKGGCYDAFNHQHSDAGAFQIYYRGWQTVDLGVYYYYGTPYDQGFNKRSYAHNVLFVKDPDEVTHNGTYNDGGQRWNQQTPKSLEDYLENPLFHTGEVLESEILPDTVNPQRAVLKVDLTKAYSDKVEKHVRTFRWLKLDREDVPVVLVVHDEVTVKDPAFKKAWQINTPKKPKMSPTGFVSEGLLPNGATIEPGRLALTVLLPKAEEREIAARCVTDLPAEIRPEYAARYPDRFEATGWQTRVTPTKDAKTQRFLNVLQVLAPGATALEAKMCEDGERVILEIDGHTVEF